MFYEEEFDGLDRNLVMAFLKNMRMYYKNKQVIMSNGESGRILFIPLNDAAHPIVEQGNDVRQTGEDWYCQEFVPIWYK